MSTLDEIVSAVEHLKPAQFVKLRRRLDELEEQLWDAELAATSAELRQDGIDDRQIDQMVVRRRRESRS